MFTDSAIQFLGGWLSGGVGSKDNPLTEEVKQELSRYRPNKPVKLYLGDEKVVFNVDRTIEFKTISSWTYDINMEANFSARIFEATFNPEDMIFDTTMLSSDFIFEIGGFPEEREVIIKPGKYKVAMI